MATTKTDCEAYMRALEEQSDAIKSATEGMLMAINTFKDSVKSVLRTVDNLKRMVDMTRRAMVIAHEARSGEDWDAELDESQYFALPVYRTMKFTRWANRCPACGGRYCSSCA